MAQKQRKNRNTTAHNRSTAASLVVLKSHQVNSHLRVALKSLGYARITSTNSHTLGIQRLKSLASERRYSFILYDAKNSDMPAAEFIQRALEEDPQGILIAVSAEPQIDDVFGQLRAGARGFLVLPFAPDTLEKVIHRALEGPLLTRSMLQAPDRNAALVGGILNSLYRLSVLKRQIRQYPHMTKDLNRHTEALAESAELARMFCEQGDEHLLQQRIIDECMARATAAASRLGRTRQKLTHERKKVKE